jgi:20S proteasome subunit beta 4
VIPERKVSFSSFKALDLSLHLQLREGWNQCSRCVRWCSEASNQNMAATLIGFRCNDFVLLAASGTAAHYYIKIRDDEDTIAEMDENKLLALSGENGDRVNFAQLVSRNLALQRMRAHDRRCSTPTAANYIRTTLAQALRRGPYQVSSLFAGFDTPLSEYDEAPPQSFLYYLDYMGTMEEVPFGAHGYGASFAIAIMDEKWRPDLTVDQAAQLMQDCIEEVKRRVIISNPKFIVKVVSARGTERVTNIE